MGGGQLIIKMRLRPPLEPLKNVKGQCEIKQGAISCTFGDPPPITGRLDIVRPVTAGTIVLRYCISQVQGSAIGIPASRDSERLLHSSPEPKNGSPSNAKILRDRLSIHHGLVQLSNPEYPAR
ncbi:hypothetical protein BO79DRAFT_277657 [Aspergillus costaricaensis CBS 115574]|uniref:Uncharacterized protein n=1 Tax=Aspergillus costaricaensis CBS 115574 TaxID=1448317 RepID=A0ACD1I1A9_9EURO|nr:hypothetical protein BO79DRAFT_277657 [Aspergillus costaricaensis CBS 115574]RAK83558.1 hypothetical protein BO79DRAFT_277657 [Aspergillus costaricaensis CBS 115574]